MSITNYQCNECPAEVGTWPLYQKHKKEIHNAVYVNGSWHKMKSLFKELSWKNG